jgi:S1-C subfamily serine protease
MDGAYITEVQQGGVAQKAGIKEGDIIIEINLVKVKNSADVQEQISKLHPGEQAIITVIRNLKQKEIIVYL